MKKLFFLIFSSILQLGCNKTTNSAEIGEGMEIYLTKSPKTNDYSIDYNKLKIDTIELDPLPIIKYNEITSYSKASHTMKLSINTDEVKSDIKSVYGRMFILTLDKKPIYCGFMWPLVSSATCSHVFIFDKLVGPNGEKNIMKIKFTNPTYFDPRSNSKLMSRLRDDNKLIN
jgi:hypothetical protein